LLAGKVDSVGRNNVCVAANGSGIKTC